MSEWLWLAPAVIPVCGLLRWLALFRYGRWLLKHTDDHPRAMRQVEALARVMRARPMLPQGKSTDGN
jgi:hypothetical protein